MAKKPAMKRPAAAARGVAFCVGCTFFDCFCRRDCRKQSVLLQEQQQLGAQDEQSGSAASCLAAAHRLMCPRAQGHGPARVGCTQVGGVLYNKGKTREIAVPALLRFIFLLAQVEKSQVAAQKKLAAGKKVAYVKEMVAPCKIRCFFPCFIFSYLAPVFPPLLKCPRGDHAAGADEPQ